jgi:uncharacterized protein YutE (UPF0331/DUF86 family)
LALIDKVLILRKLAELETLLSQIQEYAGISAELYRADWKTQRIIERTLQLMVEHCVDIANHIISDRELPIPTSYANTFEILNQASLISDDLTKTMVRVVKFRNILVHQYTQVDAAIVVSILQSNLIDFIRFRDEIASSMKQG